MSDPTSEEMMLRAEADTLRSQVDTLRAENEELRQRCARLGEFAGSMMKSRSCGGTHLAMRELGAVFACETCDDRI